MASRRARRGSFEVAMILATDLLLLEVVRMRSPQKVFGTMRAAAEESLRVNEARMRVLRVKHKRRRRGASRH